MAVPPISARRASVEASCWEPWAGEAIDLEGPHGPRRGWARSQRRVVVAAVVVEARRRRLASRPMSSVRLQDDDDLVVAPPREAAGAQARARPVAFIASFMAGVATGTCLRERLVCRQGGVCKLVADDVWLGKSSIEKSCVSDKTQLTFLLRLEARVRQSSG